MNRLFEAKELSGDGIKGLSCREQEVYNDAERVRAKNALFKNTLTPEHLSGPWTQFYDMHSGGGTKIRPFDKIYIQAPELEARYIFQEIFDRHPEHVSCSCCGEDYSVTEFTDLLQATGSERHAHYDGTKYLEEPDHSRRTNGYPLVPIEEHIRKENNLCVFAYLIKSEWRPTIEKLLKERSHESDD